MFFHIGSLASLVTIKRLFIYVMLGCMLVTHALHHLTEHQGKAEAIIIQLTLTLQQPVVQDPQQYSMVQHYPTWTYGLITMFPEVLGITIPLPQVAVIILWTIVHCLVTLNLVIQFITLMFNLSKQFARIWALDLKILKMLFTCIICYCLIMAIPE